jgi:hypothetical protein
MCTDDLRRRWYCRSMPSSTGSCMCGSVAFSINGPLRDVFNCHCDRCRRFTGHHMAATATDPANIVFDSDETLTWFSPAEGVEYGFCARCGSSLFWRTAVDPSKHCITAGSLNQPTGLTTTHAWYVAEAGDYHKRQPGLSEHAYEAD